MSHPTKLLIQVEIPPPSVEKEDRPDKIHVEDRVRDLIDAIESGHESSVEWLTLHKLYCCLEDMPKKTPRVKRIMETIQPVLAKYGYHK